MSCVFFVAPIIASWPLFYSAAASIAGSLGYHILTDVQSAKEDTEHEVEIDVENNQLLPELLNSKGSFSLKKEGIIIKFEKDTRGYCRVCASGSGQNDTELKKIGKTIFNKIMQEYAYCKVKEELSAKGFTVLEEKIDSHGTIQIQVRRWS